MEHVYSYYQIVPITHTKILFCFLLCFLLRFESIIHPTHQAFWYSFHTILRMIITKNIILFPFHTPNLLINRYKKHLMRNKNNDESKKILISHTNFEACNFFFVLFYFRIKIQSSMCIHTPENTIIYIYFIWDLML